MRNAERFLSQGKIRAAIGEYQRVVENDPKDFSTLNILGDLYAKNLDKQQAVGCFTQVADYYNMQGFSHKAIAVYNKISRIEPSSMEVSAKLAELYQSKGSIAEARVHYTTLAENYQRKGQKIEALAIWKQIAELDGNNTDIYLKIAETCWQEEQFDESAQAFTEAGWRFVRQEKYESALAAFSRTLEIKKNDLRALKGLVNAQINLGCADEAADTLEKILKEQPYNRDILDLLIDCQFEMKNLPEAEQTIVKLVEQEPTNYPRFLDLVKLYLKDNNLDAAARILSLSSEHLLGGGQAGDFLEWANEILARNPEHTAALRLLVRFHGWQRNEPALKQSLEQLAEAARLNDDAEDEHYALAQLSALAPQEIAYSSRLQELNHTHGLKFELPTSGNGNGNGAAESPVEDFEAAPVEELNGQNGHSTEFSFAEVASSYDFETHNQSADDSANGANAFDFYRQEVEATVVAEDFEINEYAAVPETIEQPAAELKLADEIGLRKELDSIEFYVEQGYQDLAEKSLDELEARFGNRAEIIELRRQLNDHAAPPIVEIQTAEYLAQPAVESKVAEIYQPPAAAKIELQQPSAVEKQSIAPKETNAKATDFLDELNSEFNLNEAATAKDGDYETHYHMATAYKEMGLTEKAIKEFQDAINLVEIDDGTRRFFQCAILLGHCFMDKRMPNSAVTWFNRSLQVADLLDEEKHALYYEIAHAFETDNKPEKAVDYFEKLYAENVDYRDVGQRLENLRENYLQT